MMYPYLMGEKVWEKNLYYLNLAPDGTFWADDIILYVLIFQNPPELPVLVFLGNSPK
jgi:hypothetical protein